MAYATALNMYVQARYNGASRATSRAEGRQQRAHSRAQSPASARNRPASTTTGSRTWDLPTEVFLGGRTHSWDPKERSRSAGATRSRDAACRAIARSNQRRGVCLEELETMPVLEPAEPLLKNLVQYLFRMVTTSLVLAAVGGSLVRRPRNLLEAGRSDSAERRQCALRSWCRLRRG